MVRKLLRPHGFAWIALSAGVSGLSTYVLLVEIAAGLGAFRFDGFSLYWAVLVVLSVGAFLPLEQIVARNSASGVPFHQIRGWAIRWGAISAALACLALLGVSAVADQEGQISLVLVVVFAVNLFAVAIQAVVRGVAAGRHQLDTYACVIVCDALMRTILCAALAVRHVSRIEAYASALALGSGVSVVLGLLLLRRRPRNDQARPGAVTSAGLSREARSLVPAMLAMQLLLNSPIFVAFFFDERGVNAGRVLAIASLVRTAVFVAQAAQAAYVGRIAALVHDRSAQAARAMSLVLGLALALASATVVVGSSLGPWLVQLLYGEEFSVSRSLCFFVSAGTAVFLVAIVANDLAVARGMHRHAGAYWSLGALAAVASASVLPDGNPRTFLPIMVGSGLALVLTALGSRQVDRARSE